MSNLDVMINFDLVAERAILNAFHHCSIDSRLEASRLRLKNLGQSVFFRTLVKGAACLLLFLLPFLEHQHSFTQSSDYLTREDETATTKRNFFWASLPIEYVSLFILSIDAFLKLMTNSCYQNECRRCFCSFSECIKWRRLFIYVLALLISWMSFYACFGILVYHEVLNSYHGKTLNTLTFIRQLLRPIFLILQVKMIKKILKAIFYTSIQLISIILLLFLVIFLFMMIGLAIFPRHLGSLLAVDTNTVDEEGDNYFNSTSQAFWSLLVYLTTANSPDIVTPAYKHHRAYFIYFSAFFLTSNYLLLKVITALYAVRFMSFFKESMKRTYKSRIANLAIAFSAMKKKNNTVPSDTVPSEKVKGIAVQDLNLISEDEYSKLCNGQLQENLNWEAFKSLLLKIFAHRLPTENKIIKIYKDNNNCCTSCFFSVYLICRLYNNVFSLPFAVLHVIVLTAVLTAEYENSLTDPHYALVITSLVFSYLFLFELGARIISLIVHYFLCPCIELLRFKCTITLQSCSLRCLHSFWKWLFSGYNLRAGYALKQSVPFLLDFFDIILLLVIIVLGFVHVPCLSGGMRTLSSGMRTDDNCLGITNLILLIQINLTLVAFRMFRMLTLIPAFAIIFRTLLHTLILLFPFLVLAYLLYYEFAIIGIALFRHTNLTDVPAAAAMECGTYQNLEYYPYNFGDYGSSLVVLWNLMIVNNWHIIVEAYVQTNLEAVRGYFVVWWLIIETILNGVIFGVLLEIMFSVLDEFFKLTKDLKKRKSFWSKCLLIFEKFVWWGKSSEAAYIRVRCKCICNSRILIKCLSILAKYVWRKKPSDSSDLSWNVYDVIHKLVERDIDDKDLEAITIQAIEEVKEIPGLKELFDSSKPDGHSTSEVIAAVDLDA